MKRFFIFIAVMVMLVTCAFAARVDIDGVGFEGARLVDSVTYVPLRAFCGAFAEYEVEWCNETRTASVIGDDFNVSVRIGDCYIESNGRYIYSGNVNIIIDGITYVPIRSLAKVLGASVVWDNESKTALVFAGSHKFESADEFYRQDELYWLSKIINAESSGESLEGKIAVGNVVLNRVESEEFPNTIYGVIFDQRGGVQFTPVANGSIKSEPNEESIVAAKICLENYRLSNENIMFFLNPSISTSTWVPENRYFVMSIGRHDFYA